MKPDPPVGETTKKSKSSGRLARPAAVEDSEQKARAARHTARLLTDGTTNAVVITHYLPHVNDGGDVETLSGEADRQARAIAGGDFSHLEKMLLTQATALQAMFADLACKARAQSGRDNMQALTGLALKAAAGSRQAIVALAELRMPKSVMFAKQANVANGPQQVNNGVAAPASPARAEEIRGQPNELLEAQHGNYLDTGATGTAGSADPNLEAVGAGHRARHG